MSLRSAHSSSSEKLLSLYLELVRERPESKLLLSDLPEAREPERLDGQEENDQGAKDHQLEVRSQALAGAAGEEGVRRHVQADRQQHDERRAQEGAEHAPHAADDDHEENLEGARQIEGLRLDRAQVREGPERAGDSAIEGADGA